MLKGRLGLESARIPQADRHGLLWLSRGNLFVKDGTLRFATAGTDDLPAGNYAVPYQTITAILMQPGTTISHDAMRILARHGTGIVAVGDGGVRFYASMPFGPNESARARRQATLWAQPDRRVAVARRMYGWRLGELLPVTDINALRGIEGARMKKSYELQAAAYGISWRGRRYDRFNPESADIPNQAINHAASAVEAVAMIAVAVTGVIPQLGFIHEDAGIALPLDIADLYRDTVLLPIAFGAARDYENGSGTTIEACVRRHAAKKIVKDKVVPKMIDRIKELFDDSSCDEERV